MKIFIQTKPCFRFSLLVLTALLQVGFSPCSAAWPVTAGTSGHDELTHTIPAGETGDQYVAGTIHPSHGESIQLGLHSLQGKGAADGLVGRVDVFGNWVWATVIGNNSDSDGIINIVADREQNLYVTGRYEGDLQIGSTTLNGTHRLFNVYLAKFSDDGRLLWAKRAGHASQSLRINDMALFQTSPDADPQRVSLYLVGDQHNPDANFLAGQMCLLRYDGGGGRLEKTISSRLVRDYCTGRAVSVGSDWIQVAVYFRNDFYLDGDNRDYQLQVRNLMRAVQFFRIHEGSLPNRVHLSKGVRMEGSVMHALHSNAVGDATYAVFEQERSAGNSLIFKNSYDSNDETDNWQLMRAFPQNDLSVDYRADEGDFAYAGQTRHASNQSLYLGRIREDNSDVFQVHHDDLPVSTTNDLSVGPHDRITVVGSRVTERGRDFFMTKTSPQGILEPMVAELGSAVPIPPEAIDPTTGDLYREPVRYFDALGNVVTAPFVTIHENGKKAIYALAPGQYTIEWAGRDFGNPPHYLDTGLRQAVSVPFPANPIIHIAGTPIDLKPVGVDGAPPDYTFHSVVYRHATTPDPVDGILIPSQTGESDPADAHTVVLYAQDGQIRRVVVLRSVHWWEASRLFDAQGRPRATTAQALIGSGIVAPELHSDVSGRTGFVLHAASPFDGAGSRAAHQRMARSGPIVPVNTAEANPGPPQTDLLGRPARFSDHAAGSEYGVNRNDLVVVYYQQDAALGVAWPGHAVLYRPQWPRVDHQLQSLEVTGTGLTDIPTSPNEGFGAFHLNPLQGRLAWIDARAARVQFRADESAQSTTLAEMTGKPGDLAVAPDGNEYYWTDPDDGALYRADANGQNASLIYHGRRLHQPHALAVADDFVYVADPQLQTIVRLLRDGTGRADSEQLAAFLTAAVPAVSVTVTDQNTHDAPVVIEGQAAIALLRDHGAALAALLATRAHDREGDYLLRARANPLFLHHRFAAWSDDNLENEELQAVHFSHDASGNGRLTWRLARGDTNFVRQTDLDGCQTLVQETRVRDGGLVAGPEGLIWLDADTNQVCGVDLEGGAPRIYHQADAETPVKSPVISADGGRLFWIEWHDGYRGRIIRHDVVTGEQTVLAEDLRAPDHLVLADQRLFWRETGVDQIVIAAQQGSEFAGQPVLDLEHYPQLHLYTQADRSLPGFNPNNEHAAFFPSNLGSGQPAIFALRSDLTDVSAPYVLAKYRQPESSTWLFKLYRVVDRGYGHTFTFHGEAGKRFYAPYPLRIMNPCLVTLPPEPWAAPYWRDYTNAEWAVAEGRLNRRFFYPRRDDFYWDETSPDLYTGQEGDCIPWLDGIAGEDGTPATPGTPLNCIYRFTWPDDVPVLTQGETLLRPKRGLPEIMDQAAVQVVYERRDGAAEDEPFSLVRLADVLSPVAVTFDEVQLADLPEDVATLNDGADQRLLGNVAGTLKIPFSLRSRLRVRNRTLFFEGRFDETVVGEPLLLVNVLTRNEADRLKNISDNTDFHRLVETLYRRSRNPNEIDPQAITLPDYVEDDSGYYVGLSLKDERLEPTPLLARPGALSAAKAKGTGYVTLVFNNHESLNPLPVSVKPIRVGCLEPNVLVTSPYVGEIKIVQSDNLFDEQLTLRHSGDFGGSPDHLEFEWFIRGANPDGSAPEPPRFDETGEVAAWNGWRLFAKPDDGPDAARGRVAITIEGAGPQTLADNWVMVRYRGMPGCDNQQRFSMLAGDPGGSVLQPRPALAEGWLKRVTNRLTPFERRVADFRETPVNTLASMLSLLGARYEGEISFSGDGDYLEQLGLIEAYESVLRRGMDLSVNAVPPVNNGDTNAALLLAASRLADAYQLLGNEAFADAVDPTIGFDTGSVLGSEATAFWTFRNQTVSPLDEELALLMGRSDAQTGVRAAPLYNRLPWNMTGETGEVTYVATYNLQDTNLDGFINETDARIRFPQGHGDAWGHYLYAMKVYYLLLRHPDYTWIPRTESVQVGGLAVGVDYLDERKFARGAAAKAKAGLEILDLIYRKHYVADPTHQWQGYRDTTMVPVPTPGAGPGEETLQARAWGVDGWARRCAQGAFFDWVTGNTMLRYQDEDNEGIAKIDRTSVAELNQIAAHCESVQARMDGVDAGLNPLGLAKGVVPFDLTPALVTFRAGKPHFEQIYDRTLVALNNTKAVFDRANQHTHMLRYQNETVQAFTRQNDEQERSFRHRLIELFGYPYSGHMGPGKLYASDYDGPDLVHHNYIERPAALGPSPGPLAAVQRTLQIPAELDFHAPSVVTDLGGLDRLNRVDAIEVDYLVPANGLDIVTAPPELGSRRAIGEAQRKLAQLLILQSDFRRFLARYDNHLRLIDDNVELLEAFYQTSQDEIALAVAHRNTSISLNTSMLAAGVAKATFEEMSRTSQELATTLSMALPKVNGVSNDVTSTVRSSIVATGDASAGYFRVAAAVMDLSMLGFEQGKEIYRLDHEIKVLVNTADYEALQKARELEQLIREEMVLRLEGFTLADQVKQAALAYQATLAEGERLIESWLVFRKNAAAVTQGHRYKDMAFRLFRGDALQKFHAQFDLAARYVYLAAAAYDYDTNLLGAHQDGGRRFLSQVVAQRGLGEIKADGPVVGSGGLAGALGKLKANYSVYKSQMGFNNPQFEAQPFSLRRELFRINEGDAGSADWQALLRDHRVPDLWQIPEFVRHCRPFAPAASGPQPGLVIPFATVNNLGENFFGWPLSAGDGAYDPSRFSTRIRSSGVWLSGYDQLPLAETPRAYLVPAGMDILRSPFSNDFTQRTWRVMDQILPAPFPIGASDLADPDWMPWHDTLGAGSFTMRRFPMQRAYDDLAGTFDEAFTTTDSRLVGRSVANDRWLLIIPGATLLGNAEQGLDRLIGETVGEGISDIKIFFSTYAYQGLGRKQVGQPVQEEEAP